MMLKNAMSNTPIPPPDPDGAAFKHGSNLSGKIRPSRVRSQWKSTSLPADLALVMGSKTLLEQVILNIIVNACDAYEEKPEISTRPVIVKAHMTPDMVTVTIQDRAGGIPDALLATIFEPYFTTKNADKGTGLGLSLSMAMMTEMGGTLAVHNIDGGACFELGFAVAA
jgi:C4-dicarboxylate-specific signal transduction histidine kinase